MAVTKLGFSEFKGASHLGFESGVRENSAMFMKYRAHMISGDITNFLAAEVKQKFNSRGGPGP